MGIVNSSTITTTSNETKQPLDQPQSPRSLLTGFQASRVSHPSAKTSHRTKMPASIKELKELIELISKQSGDDPYLNQRTSELAAYLQQAINQSNGNKLRNITTATPISLPRATGPALNQRTLELKAYLQQASNQSNRSKLENANTATPVTSPRATGSAPTSTTVI